MKKEVIWEVLSWSDLTKESLHDILQVRTQVFVVEQNCPYQEVDGKDKHSIHVLGRTKEEGIVAYARIPAPGISYNEVSIGRVLTHESTRGSGIGKELMSKTLNAIRSSYGKVAVRISAQQYLLKFYSGFGFEQKGEMYLEDDIPHIEMLKINWE